MVFSSSLFLFVFLPLFYILHNGVKGIKAKNYILIAASLLFYSFGRLDWLLLLVVSAICNYIAGLFMLKSGPIRKTALVVAVCINLGLLCVFKYANFFTETINMLPFVNITPTNIALPIGISFFTFQGMSYVIDAYRDKNLASPSFGKVLLYIAFFPQLVAGPIVKYNDIEAQIDSRSTTPEYTVSGIKRFVTGLVKKLFFANIFGKIADIVYGTDMQIMDFRLAWLGVLCYTLQIYYDFSAYSDMAIGLGRMFGFEINENFRHPYCAKSVKDFWRRWHISLSQWFRDYLYIPLGGNRRGVARARLNRVIVFFFTGLWHGANWTFVVWGLWHGLFLMLEDVFSHSKVKLPVVGRVYTLLVVALGFMLFRAENMAQAADMFHAMLMDFSLSEQAGIILGNILTPYTVFMLIAGIVFVMPVLDFCKSRLARKNIVLPQTLVLTAVMAVFVLCMIKLAASSFNPFIYTQF
ncbi:MAG: MBOAT family protein [Clostridia bacterium]|nr:MBOAT family protein [Clostridia bacterium]